ncbi:glutathione S-transferase family protein [Altericroceibacterium spongiae]|uniref:Glutathione S-transferase family protein n=1 Tax=Altericroceibacterium spongiae TaxID=2320269 RepID=A0A420EM16_9SPHN|nr:glutathione S-transferase family protein [Altericroceibacterium spongiae]RKF21762.1 glutathione S-transferase family protein [Altericroceibacterium spongiae]
MAVLLELYVNDLSPFTRPIELQLEMKGLDFKRITPTRDFVREGGFGEISPIRKIPVLMVDGAVIAESRVISELIEDLYPTPPLLPEAPLDRARVRMLATIATVYLADPAVQLLGNMTEGNSQDIEARSVALIRRGLAGLEEWIAPGPYAAGETPSIADCAVAPALFFLKDILSRLGFTDCPEWGERTRACFAAMRRDADIERSLMGMEACLSEKLAQTQG